MLSNKHSLTCILGSYGVLMPRANFIFELTVRWQLLQFQYLIQTIVSSCLRKEEKNLWNPGSILKTGLSRDTHQFSLYNLQSSVQPLQPDQQYDQQEPNSQQELGLLICHLLESEQQQLMNLWRNHEGFPQFAVEKKTVIYTLLWESDELPTFCISLFHTFCVLLCNIGNTCEIILLEG